MKGVSRVWKCLAILAICVPLPALHAAPQTNETALVRSCEAQISGKFRQWRIAPVKEPDRNQTRLFADFDGDGRRDVALLITTGADRHIAICLNTRSALKLYLIDKPYCNDGIAISRKGVRYYDFENDKEGVYARDGVHAYCSEKAGATYQFENDAFRRIVDDD